jgi:hypothetical protein
MEEIIYFGQFFKKKKERAREWRKQGPAPMCPWKFYDTDISFTTDILYLKCGSISFVGKFYQ